MSHTIKLVRPITTTQHTVATHQTPIIDKKATVHHKATNTMCTLHMNYILHNTTNLYILQYLSKGGGIEKLFLFHKKICDKFLGGAFWL